MNSAAGPVEDYLSHLAVERRTSAHTLDAYRRDLSALAAWAALQSRELLELTGDDLLDTDLVGGGTSGRRIVAGEHDRGQPEAPQLLGAGAVGGGHRLDEHGQDDFDVDTGADLRGLGGDLAFEQLADAQRTAQLSADRRARRGAQHHIRIPHRCRDLGGFVGDSLQDAGLPRDAGDAATSQNECTLSH